MDPALFDVVVDSLDTPDSARCSGGRGCDSVTVPVIEGKGLVGRQTKSGREPICPRRDHHVDPATTQIRNRLGEDAIPRDQDDFVEAGCQMLRGQDLEQFEISAIRAGANLDPRTGPRVLNVEQPAVARPDHDLLVVGPKEGGLDDGASPCRHGRSDRGTPDDILDVHEHQTTTPQCALLRVEGHSVRRNHGNSFVGGGRSMGTKV